MTASRGQSSIIIAVAASLTLTLAVSACEDPTLGRGITVRNETDVAVRFQWLLDGEVVTFLGELSPGSTNMLVGAANLGEYGRFGSDGCTTVPVVALGPNDEQVAWADPPLCVGDEWVIETP